FTDRVLYFHNARFYVLGYALVQRLRNHRDLVFLIWRNGVTRCQRRVPHSLAEPCDWIGDFYLHVSIEAAEIMKHTIHIQFASAKNDMLSRFLDLCRDKRVALVDLSQAVKHFWKFRRVDGLHSHLQN